MYLKFIRMFCLFLFLYFMAALTINFFLEVNLSAYYLYYILAFIIGLVVLFIYLTYLIKKG